MKTINKLAVTAVTAVTAVAAATLLSCAQALAQSAPTAPAATASTVVSTAVPATPVFSKTHLAAVAALLRTLHLEELLQTGMQQSLEATRKVDPARADRLVQTLQAQPPNFLFDPLTALFAKYFSQADAEQAQRFYQSPAGRKVVINDLRSTPQLRDKYAPPAPLTRDELQAYQAFLRSPVGLRLAHNPPDLNADLRALMQATGARLAQQAFGDLLAPLRREMADALAHPDAAPSADPASQGKQSDQSDQSGQDAISQISRIGVDGIRRYRQLVVSYNQETEALFKDDILAPEKLVTAEGIAAGKKTVELGNQALERYVQQADQIKDEIRQRMDSVPLPPPARTAMMAQFNAAQQRSMQTELQSNEVQRAQLSLFMQVLDLMQSCLGRARVLNDQLVFDDEADRLKLVQLGQQLRDARARQQAVREEALGRMKANADMIR